MRNTMTKPPGVAASALLARLRGFVRNRTFRRMSLLWAVLLACSFLVGACAQSQMQRIMPHMSNMQLAHAYFGNPTASEKLPDGTVRHEWVLDRLFTHPGGMRTVQVYVGHDRDGYRQYVEREVYVRPWGEQQYCKMTIVADRDGRVLQSSWEGRNCNELPLMRVAE